MQKMHNASAVARYKAEHEKDHIQKEVNQLANFVQNLTGDDEKEIRSRYRGFNFTCKATPDRPQADSVASTIVNYD